MKKIVLFLAVIFLGINLHAQTTFNINKGVGFTFDPPTLTVNQGDIVHFNLTSAHAILQVSLATWNANDITPLPGGFSFPSGSGDYTATTPGTIYYVCTTHVQLEGMKGTIIVNAVTGIKDIHKDSSVRLFPNPATDLLTYQSIGKSDIKEIRILDIMGKIVKIFQHPEISDNKVKIDVGELKKGIYFILVMSPDGIETAKFLKS
jgi:plastocyanin